jgi:PAS domain S-box-containing protein
MGIPLRALIVEDSENDTLLVVHVLQKNGFDPVYERVETADAMKEALEREAWDIIICDYRLPHFSGPAALALFKEKELDIPFIIVSGTIGEETAADIMISGAQDCVMKDNLPRLVPSVRRELKEATSRRERRLAEEALKTQHELILTLLDSIPSPIFYKDSSGVYQGCNLALAQFMGILKEDIIGKTVYDIAPFELATMYDKTDRELFDHPGVQTYELKVKTADGAVKEVIFHKATFNDAYGAVAGLVGVMIDITERKRSEEALKESEARYRSIFENAVEGIFVSTPEGRFLSVNPAAAHLLGYASPEEFMEKVTDIGRQHYANPKDRETYKTTLESEGLIKGFEVPLINKDGNPIWASINARANRSNEGAIISYEGTIEDITPRKQAEENLKESTEKLRKTLIGVIQAMSRTVEVRDPYTAGHQRRASNLARLIAQEMALPNDTVEIVRMAGVLHDIGKIAVPSEILSKPSKLTDIEFSLIKVHPQSGYDILKDVGLPHPTAEAVLQHHERLDGSGYPQGLKNGQILLEARILAVADVVEAIASHRPYRPAFGIDSALEEIEKNKNILYDAEVVEACVKVFRERGFNFE